MQTETDKEQAGWETISEIKENWCFDNAGYDLTIKILEKDGQYRLLFIQPTNYTEDVFLELSGRPIKWLKELETLSHSQYKSLLGASGYGETDLKGIVKFLGVEIIGKFELSNIS